MAYCAEQFGSPSRQNFIVLRTSGLSSRFLFFVTAPENRDGLTRPNRNFFQF
jgi:hypothetical protein